MNYELTLNPRRVRTTWTPSLKRFLTEVSEVDYDRQIAVDLVFAERRRFGRPVRAPKND